MQWSTRLTPGRGCREYGTLELIGLGAFGFALLPGLALTALSPSAWPIPVIALVGLLTVWVAGGRRPAAPGRDRERLVKQEASSGIAQLETWLAQRHHT